MENAAAPKELYLSIAILLKNNLLLLGDLIPYVSVSCHLNRNLYILIHFLLYNNQFYPTEEEMEEFKNQYNTNMNKEISTNSAGALAVS